MGLCVLSKPLFFIMMTRDHVFFYLTMTTTFALSAADQSCPSSHPNAYLNGQYCCFYDREKNCSNPDGCGGGVLNIKSKCCKGDMFVECEKTPCKDHVPSLKSCANAKKSGVYNITIGNFIKEVYCEVDKEGNGWVVVQRRGDFGDPGDYFNKDWESYKEGFGNPMEQVWIGNKCLHLLTKKYQHLKIVVTAFDETTASLTLEGFTISDETDDYRLDFTSATPSDLAPSMEYHKNMKFSTKDKDNDKSPEDCAGYFSGGWWFKKCGKTKINGIYYKKGGHTGAAVTDGIILFDFKGYQESLKTSEMKIKM